MKSSKPRTEASVDPVSPPEVPVSQPSKVRGWTERLSIPLALALAVAFVAALIGVLQSRYVGLNIKMSSSVSAAAQLFYDQNRGFNELDSSLCEIRGGGNFYTRRLALPTQPIHAFRFDPINTHGRATIKDVSVVDGAGNVLARIPLDRIKPVSGIQNMSLQSDALVFDIPPASDAALSFDISYPVHWKPAPNSWLVIPRNALAAFFLVFTVSGVLALLVPGDYWRKLARGLNARPIWQVQCLLLPIFLFVLIFRAPYIFEDPRFWAEEGTVWFQYAITHSVFDTLVFILPASGYFNLAANIAAAAAAVATRTADLQYAPLMTVTLAFLIQATAVFVVLFGRSRLLDSLWKKLIACLIILIAPPSVGEIWFNSINSMSWLGLITALLLFEDTSGWRPITKGAVRSLVVLCGLTGIYSAVLAPLFLLAWYLYRQREHLVHGAILIACLAIQIGSMMMIRSSVGLENSRFSHVTLDTALVNVFFYHVLTPFAGIEQVREFFQHIGLTKAFYISSTMPRIATVIGEASIAAAVIAASLLVLTFVRFTKEKLLLACLFGLFSILTATASLGGVPGGRYAFLPGITLLLLVLASIGDGRPHFAAALSMMLIANALWIGLDTYQWDQSLNQHLVAPSWKQEAAAWKANPTHRLRVWPGWWAGSIVYTRQ